MAMQQIPWTRRAFPLAHGGVFQTPGKKSWQ